MNISILEIPKMATLKITKKHNKHLNNPFTSPPQSGPFVEGKLFVNSQALPSHQIFDIGKDFQLNWSSKDGGFLSISHRSQPTRHIWSSVPGQAFISAAVAETEVEESRGSFLVKDNDVHVVCDHQTIECIRAIKDDFDVSVDVTDENLPSFSDGSATKIAENDRQSPAVMLTGRIISSKKRNKKVQDAKNSSSAGILEESSIFAKYCILFDQKNSNQVGFQVKLGKPNVELHQRVSPKIYKGFARKLTGIRRRRIGWSRSSSKRKVYVAVSSSSDEENVVMKAARLTDFNRIWLTYESEKSEKFYGFGEQFSHMNLKGKRVPIFVQEQGIGRGDQPITFAANLVSYRAGGDWSTTYAPSPFYMTSRMRSLYLEGYHYSIFDLTKLDRVQIQINGDCVQGRILHGHSPTELIENFTETIGRPPELPEWIISGAVVGMQGGTDAVRNAWNQLQTYNVPISAFWLQDWVGQRETVIGSQLWWNWEVDSARYMGWQQLIKDLRTQHINVMTYCNPCLAPMDNKPNVKRNLYEEAKKLDILIKDKHGKPYTVPNTAFDVGMLDLTHPSTASWFKQILRGMVDDGVRGWMADFGEGLPVDAHLQEGLMKKFYFCSFEEDHHFE